MSQFSIRSPGLNGITGIALPGLMIIGLAVTLSGCATYSREDCEFGDWEMLGYNAAMQGKGASRYEAVVKDCERFGVLPDLDLFTVGFDKGRRTYCTPARGFGDGRSNTPPEFACPRDQASDFNTAFQMGHEIWTVEKPLRDQERTLSYAERRVDSLSSDLDALDCGAGDDFERTSCRTERKRLRPGS